MTTSTFLSSQQSHFKVVENEKGKCIGVFLVKYGSKNSKQYNKVMSSLVYIFCLAWVQNEDAAMVVYMPVLI